MTSGVDAQEADCARVCSRIVPLVYGDGIQAHERLAAITSRYPEGFFRPFHRATAARLAISERRCGVRVTSLRLPPIFPPLAPCFLKNSKTSGGSLPFTFHSVTPFSRKRKYAFAS
jgi:hypothetical protein